MRLHDRPADRKSHPHAILLCSEEWLEDPLAIGRLDAGSGILDPDTHAARFGAPTAHGGSVLRRFLHGLDGIRHKVEDNLLQLNAVPVNARYRFVELRFKLDTVFAEVETAGGKNRKDQFVEIEPRCRLSSG